MTRMTTTVGYNNCIGMLRTKLHTWRRRLILIAVVVVVTVTFTVVVKSIVALMMLMGSRVEACILLDASGTLTPMSSPSERSMT